MDFLQTLIISRPHLLSRAPTYYLAPPLIISRPQLSRAPHLLSRAPTHYMSPEIE